MNLIYDGKTKTVFECGDGNYVLRFKDAACGKDGVFDPGENQIGLTITGKGRAGLQLSDFLFKKINAEGFPTHYVSCDLDKAEMTVRPGINFGKGVEVICRYRATGSFVRRYGDYINDGAILEPPLVEVTLKDDKRGDPPATKDTLASLGILTEDEYETLVTLTRNITGVIKRECDAKDLELIDLKLEFGRDSDGQIMVIDEISGDVMRVATKDSVKARKYTELVEPIELTRILTNN